MKPLRLFLRNSALALLSVSTLSCIDNAYNLSDLSTEAELFKNSLSAPVGTATIYLDSIIGGNSIDSLSVKDGMYVFGYSGHFNLDNLTNTFNDFKLSTIDSIRSDVNLYDASNVPEGFLPFPLPITETKDYPGNIDITLPTGFGNTSLIKIDSATLKDTYITISSVCTGLKGGNGKTLGDNLKITFTAEGDAADYYIDGVKKKTWDLPFGESITVRIGKIRLTKGDNKLSLSRNVKVNVANPGDIVATKNIMTSMRLSMKFTNGVDFSMLWGKVNYAMSGKLDDIRFEGLGKTLKENDVLSIYNPKIMLNTKGNLGVPIKLNLNMSTFNSNTGASASLTNSTFNMLPALSPKVPVSNTFILNKDNGTSNLFKINPDLIKLGYNIQTDTTKSNHFIAKDSTNLNVAYKMEIPLQFGSDLRISIDTTLENPFVDNLDKLENQKDLAMSLVLNIKNRIPLNMEIELEALGSNFDSLFTVKTDPILAALTTAGRATDVKETTTEISLTPAQINMIKDTKMFRVIFVITAKQGEEFVSVHPSDYITIKIGGKINGGLLIDLSSKNSN